MGVGVGVGVPPFPSPVHTQLGRSLEEAQLNCLCRRKGTRRRERSGCVVKIAMSVCLVNCQKGTWEIFLFLEFFNKETRSFLWLSENIPVDGTCGRDPV